jgi:tetratricopeptide (TPR) repeat protein
MSKASIYGKMKKWDEAIETYRGILAKVTSKKDGYDRLRDERVRFEIGRSNIEIHKFEEALVDFGEVISGNEATPDEKANAHLWMGKILDSKKDRTHALEHYNALAGLNCDPELKEEADRYKRRPFVG